MRFLSRSTGGVLAIILVLLAGNSSAAVNPMALYFKDGDTTNISTYSHPTALIVVGRCNDYDPAFVAAHKAGTEVLYYIDAVERPDNPIGCSLDDDFYFNNPGIPSQPLWPYPSYGQKTNYPGTHLTDIRAGSAWSQYVVNFVKNLMTDPNSNFDGVFLDVTGARLWSVSADWDNLTSWPQTDKDAWTNGNVDLVRQLDALRRQYNPRFIVVNNNVWDGNGTLGSQGEPYVDGVELEGDAYNPYHIGYVDPANHPFSNLGHRRVLIVSANQGDVQNWASLPGVTNVTYQPLVNGVYDHGPNPPSVPCCTRLTDRGKTFGITTAGTVPSSGLNADYKRASKFYLPENGTLVKLDAFIDGAGGASGVQSVKLVLYADNGGVPGAKLAESASLNISSTDSSQWGWRGFSINNIPLNAGNYWVAIFTGGTAQVIRDFGSGTATNWYGNADTFSDGASNPFGIGTSGNTTLSIYVTYTVGQ